MFGSGLFTDGTLQVTVTSMPVSTTQVYFRSSSKPGKSTCSSPTSTTWVPQLTSVSLETKIRDTRQHNFKSLANE